MGPSSPTPWERGREPQPNPSPAWRERRGPRLEVVGGEGLPPTEYLRNQFPRLTPNKINPLDTNHQNPRNPLQTRAILRRMETNPFTPEEHAAITAGLDDADAALTGFLVLIRTQINQNGAGLLARKLIAKILRTLLVPAEALLRRCIHILAERVASLPVRPARKPPAKPARPTKKAARTAKPRAPVFRLTEPAPRPAGRNLPLNQRPLISVPGLTPRPAPAPRRKPDPIAFEARFLRRVEALEYAFNDPLREVRRLQRRRARTKSRKTPRPNLSSGLPRGLVGSPDTQLVTLYEDLHRWAIRTADPS